MAILDFLVSGWHVFGSVSQVCFGISVSNFLCMSFVAVGRSLTIVSYVAFKIAALWFWTMPPSPIGRGYPSPIDNRSRNKRRNLWVGRCVSSWWPWFPSRNSVLIYMYIYVYIPYTSSVIGRIYNGSVIQYWRSCTPSRSIGECAVPDLNAILCFQLCLALW